VELLPAGASVTLPREALLAALEDTAIRPAVPDEPAADPERWLTADEVAAMLQTSPRWCYDHAKQLGAKKLSRRCVRFSSLAVARHLARR
jgi:hypothetical protein